jgi:hypothetical protein
MGQDAHRPTTTLVTEVCPLDLASGYHSGAVSAASRSDARRSRGSGGYLV